MPTNDNDHPLAPPTAVQTDAHGHAALLLVESLIHEMCAKSIFTADEAVAIVDRAVDVQVDHADAADDVAAAMWRSHELLLSIAASLSIDADGAPPPVR